MSRFRPIPVIDIFAGPGGLGEGFSALTDRQGRHPFKIALSIEKDPIAHKTLLLRSFFRQFPKRQAPPAYYDRLRQQISTADLLAALPKEASAARCEAWNATLGDDTSAPLGLLRQRVRDALRHFPDGESRWALIGGPPCQAYSLVGDLVNKGN